MWMHLDLCQIRRWHLLLCEVDTPWRLTSALEICYFSLFTFSPWRQSKRNCNVQLGTSRQANCECITQRIYNSSQIHFAHKLQGFAFLFNLLKFGWFDLQRRNNRTQRCWVLGSVCGSESLCQFTEKCEAIRFSQTTISSKVGMFFNNLFIYLIYLSKKKLNRNFRKRKLSLY